MIWVISDTITLFYKITGSKLGRWFCYIAHTAVFPIVHAHLLLQHIP